MTPQDFLDRAADLIEKDGWTQFIDHSPKGWCAVGALGEIFNQENLSYDNRVEVKKVLLERIRDYNYITDWNDSEYRTKEEVIATLRGKYNG